MLAFQYLHMGLALLVAAMATVLLLRRDEEGRASGIAPDSVSPSPTFLFDRDELIDATPQAMRLLRQGPQRGTDLDSVIALLSQHFARLQTSLANLDEGQKLDLKADQAPDLSVHLERENNRLRIGLRLGEGAGPDLALSGIERSAMEEEIAALRQIAQRAPLPIWRENRDGKLIWANRAYLQAVDKLGPHSDRAGAVWPEEPLFPSLPPVAANAEEMETSRQAVQLHGEAGEHWYDVARLATEKSAIHYAVDATAAVKADRMRQAFKQTLGRTFANLSTGLAVFDKERRLTIFNPALCEMTGLKAQFLAARPSIEAVLNQLREDRKLPEPRDYTTFREQFNMLIREAESGTYTENWSLTDGQVLNVTGRSHPDGGLEFLFEDITSEIAVTRRFRAEIETGQAVLDAMPEAVAVFSPGNTLVMSNAAYSDLWNISDEDVTLKQDLRSAMRIWTARCAPSKLWTRIEDFALRNGDRQPIKQILAMGDGRQATCSVKSLSGGSMMVRFDVLQLAHQSSPTLVPRSDRFEAIKR